LNLAGVTLAADTTARWLEAHASAIDRVGIAAEGFFAKPSPYLTWLGERFSLIVRASPPFIDSPEGPGSSPRGLLAVCRAARASIVVHPLGYAGVRDTRLSRVVPVSLTRRSVESVADLIRRTRDSTDCPTLAEPLTAPLRAPGSIDEPEFLVRLCERADCRLLLDVTTLLVGSRNHGFDPVAWLREIPGELIAAARIGGSRRDGRGWRHDARSDIDEAAWTLLALLLSHARPDVLLLDHRDHPHGIAAFTRELERLRSLDGQAVEATRFVVEGETRVDVPHPHARRAPQVTPSDRTADISHGVAPGIAPEVGLFVLDREGVFFSEQQQTLALFNTAATYVWCLLEEGQAPEDIVAAYAETFAVPLGEADRQVGTILTHWFGRGHITGKGSLPAEPTDLATALSWLLTNGALRERFRESPEALARLLGLEREDREMFTAIHPGEVDAHVEDDEPVEQVAAIRPCQARPDRDAGTAQAASPFERRYRLLSSTFRVRCDTADMGATIHEALAHLSLPSTTPEPQGSTPPDDIAIDVRGPSDARDWQIVEDESLMDDRVSRDGIVPVLKQLMRERAVERHPFLLSVHAGVVAFGDRCVLFPAAAGSGKTTLTAALIRAGATYFSDEIALLARGTLAVVPVPLSLTVKDGSVAPLRLLYPELDSLTTHVREDHVRVRYLPPPLASLPPGGVSAAVRWIVFPQYAPGSATSLHQLDRPEALRRMLGESFMDFNHLTRHDVGSLVQWMRGVDCYDLPFSSLDAAVGLVSGLASHRRG
jgi:uncharacterized protein (UPF0276 family)